MHAKPRQYTQKAINHSDILGLNNCVFVLPEATFPKATSRLQQAHFQYINESYKKFTFKAIRPFSPVGR